MDTSNLDDALPSEKALSHSQVKGILNLFPQEKGDVTKWASPFLLARGDSSRNKVITDLLLDWTIVPPFLYVLYVGGKYTPNVALNQCLSKLTCTRMLASLLKLTCTFWSLCNRKKFIHDIDYLRMTELNYTLKIYFNMRLEVINILEREIHYWIDFILL